MGALTIQRHEGGRGALRSLFELAEDSQSELASYIDLGEVLVAIDEGEVVGHLQLIDAEVKNMAVAPPHQGRGVGLALLVEAGEIARGAGHDTLRVATAAADVGALRFYQRAGFRMRSIERDAFTPANGYPRGVEVGGIELRDRVWLDMPLDTAT
jgi:GNAT superfamily N-acetyltransferase